MNPESAGSSTDCAMINRDLVPIKMEVEPLEERDCAELVARDHSYTRDTRIKEKPSLDLEIERGLEKEAIQFAMILRIKHKNDYQRNKHKNDDQIKLNYERTLNTVPNILCSDLTHLYRCTLCTKIWSDEKAFILHASDHKDFLHVVKHTSNYAEIILIKKPSDTDQTLNPRGNSILFANASPGSYIHKCNKCKFYTNAYERIYEHFMQFHHDDVKLPVFRHYCGCCKTAFTSENEFAEAHRSAFLCSCEMTHTSCVELYFHFNLSKCCLSYCPCGFVGGGIRTDSHIKACELIRLNRYYCPCGNHNTLFTHMKHLANCTSIPEYFLGCYFCPMSFHNKDGLIKHLKYHKNNTDLKLIIVSLNICPLCGERISSKYYNVHFQYTHSAKIRYYCVCSTIFDNTVTWANHFNNSHSVELFFNAIRKKENNNLNATVKRANINCWYCGEAFNTFAALDQHINKKMAVCSKCNVAVQKCLLKIHESVFCIYAKEAHSKIIRTNKTDALYLIKDEIEVIPAAAAAEVVVSSSDSSGTFPDGGGGGGGGDQKLTCLRCGDKIAQCVVGIHKEQCLAIFKSTVSKQFWTESDGDGSMYWRRVDSDECSTAVLSISDQNENEKAQLMSIAIDSRVTTAASLVPNSHLTSDEHTADVIELSDDSVGSPPALHRSDEEDNFSIEESGVDLQDVKTELDVDMDGDINAFIINTRDGSVARTLYTFDA